jgi:hypothetical protein
MHLFIFIADSSIILRRIGINKFQDEVNNNVKDKVNSGRSELPLKQFKFKGPVWKITLSVNKINYYVPVMTAWVMQMN